MPKKRSILLLLLLALLFGAPAFAASPVGTTGWLYVQVNGIGGDANQVSLSFTDNQGNTFWEPDSYSYSDTPQSVASYLAYWFQSDYAGQLVAGTDSTGTVLMLQFSQAHIQQTGDVNFYNVTTTPTITESGCPQGFCLYSDGFQFPTAAVTAPPATVSNSITVTQGQDGLIISGNPSVSNASGIYVYTSASTTSIDATLNAASGVGQATAADLSGGPALPAPTQTITTSGSMYEYTDPNGITLLLTEPEAAALQAYLLSEGNTTSAESITEVQTTTLTASTGISGDSTPNTTCLFSTDGDGTCSKDQAQQVAATLYSTGPNVLSTACANQPDANGCIVCSVIYTDGTRMYPKFCQSGKAPCQSPGNED
jgi:hypothetical protein